jgi:hypothetical protein
MWLNEWYKSRLGRSATDRGTRPPAPRRHGLRPTLEQLEDRTLPSNYTAASVSDLIADIKAANNHGEANTITLVANTTFTLTAVNNTADGATALPDITKGNLTIVGNGDTVERSTALATPAFRLFDVGNSGSLTLVNLTLQNGFAFGSGAAAEGGAIYNQGTLVLNGVTVQHNGAYGSDGKNGRQGGDGQDAAGGGIWSNGSLTLENGTLVQSNRAGGGWGGTAGDALDLHPGQGGNGGNAFGGGVYVAAGTVNLTSATLSSNSATGGLPGQGAVYGLPGDGFGGGLYVAGGTVSLFTTIVASNTAAGNTSYGGGLHLAGGTVYLDAFTVAHTINNQADFYPDIYGSYIFR